MELRETKCGILCLLDREELKMLNQKEVKKNDYPQLISLWRFSVEATHLFLSQADIDKIEVVLPDYFQQVQLSMWLNEEQKCVGFSGTNQQTLEMLFIDPVYFRKGYGGEIIKKLIEQESIIFVDANKQNEGAVKFYQSQGFQVIGESKEDPQGNPFPILHMKRI
ncbi:GNAT family N-acetyltransferase [Enterococcus faecalis]|uniref:GNAT family N-acetyltransferase n=1 Tax=Enterococcus faecalis TaxID=1351 RepID=UPI001925CEE3|nr:GNAT family N-acetyltransferase [Enterococcus faecalis]EHV0177594.1 GNAT family N-acetyltransferase [Enterococcus faecalis]EIP8074768.1 GNAT family N-acetyltransferase [Enterococcus faecalis]EIQ7062577.1 GNAT family N-acetyltransferase [Enterococcus faecalis]EKK0913976.1 GNAT family N-acetyltransferase [Enterococcus faecalis]